MLRELPMHISESVILKSKNDVVSLGSLRLKMWLPRKKFGLPMNLFSIVFPFLLQNIHLPSGQHSWRCWLPRAILKQSRASGQGISESLGLLTFPEQQDFGADKLSALVKTNKPILSRFRDTLDLGDK